MGKKKKPPQPYADGIIRTGIYQRRVTPQKMAGDELGAALDQWADEANRSASERLEGIRQELQRITENPDDAEQARDAREALRLLQAVEYNLGGNQDTLLRNALLLGRYLERIEIRPFEPLASTGRKVKVGGSKGAVTANRGRAEMYAKEAKSYQSEVDALVAKGQSYTKATENVALSHRVHAKTVQRNTQNTAPQNRSRHQRG